jgi:signal transduction histidine kinase
MSLRPLSLRGKFTLIVLGGAVLPLALLGSWLTRTAERSGEALLRDRLETSITEIVSETGLRWIALRSQLTDLAEHPALQDALRQGAAPAGSLDTAVLRELRAARARMQGAVELIVVRDPSAEERWTLAAEAGLRRELVPMPGLPVELAIYDTGSGEELGTLDVRVRMSSLLASGAGWERVGGSVLAIFDRSSGASLLPLTIDPGLFRDDRFVWGNEPWLAVRHVLYEPAVELVLAAPLSPFTEPFQQAARRNLLILAAVAVGGFTLAALLTRRTTRGLERLADAAEAVSQGELDRRVEETRGDEVGRVGHAFNTMTESLRRTLRELSQREALAAVGEFASSLAHEVRNPLSAIRVDLQRVEEELPASQSRDLLARALGEVERLDRSVTGALRVARSGSVAHERLDLRRPLEAALHAAAPEFTVRGASLEVPPLGSEPVWVSGDAAALEQLYLNLLLNAAQALDPGGAAGVTLEVDGERAATSVWDRGRGMAPADLKRAFEPFFSTKPAGTGLGLAIAQRIALAHRGELTVESTAFEGTTARFELLVAGATS